VLRVSKKKGLNGMKTGMLAMWTGVLTAVSTLCLAADPPSAVFTSSLQEEGQKLVITLGGSNLAGIYSVTFDLGYDPAVVEIGSGTVGALLSGAALSSILDTAARTISISVDIFDTIRDNGEVQMARLAFDLAAAGNDEGGVVLTHAGAEGTGDETIELATSSSEVRRFAGQPRSAATVSRGVLVTMDGRMAGRGDFRDRSGAFLRSRQTAACGQYVAVTGRINGLRFQKVFLHVQ
jgi:hypothetical protein